MRLAREFVMAFVALVTVTACSTVSSGSGPGRASSDVITTAEMDQHRGEDLLTVIQRVRPGWLQLRPSLSTRGENVPVVVVDGVPQPPGLDPLRGFRADDVHEVRRLSARDATTRFGTDMGGGAILVATKR